MALRPNHPSIYSPAMKRFALIVLLLAVAWPVRAENPTVPLLKLGSGEPGIALKAAVGSSVSGHAPTPVALEQSEGAEELARSLAGTRWEWSTAPGKPSHVVLTFNVDGTFFFSDNVPNRESWTALDRRTILFGRRKARITFSKNLTTLECPDWGGQARYGKRIPKPEVPPHAAIF